MAATPVIMLPGIVLPAALAYPPLIAALGDGVDSVPKELEVYAGAEPAAGYGLESEIAGITRVADDSGFERFHLVGYSGGGASALAFASRNPGRLLSLALLEPAWAGDIGLGPEERAVWDEFDRIKTLPADQRMPAFMRAQIAPDVVLAPQPAEPPPPWMALRPAGVAAFLGALAAFHLDLGPLRDADWPVYYAVGGRSNPDYFARQADRLATVFGDFTVEVYEERHHFDPPHRVEPDRLAASLGRVWSRT